MLHIVFTFEAGRGKSAERKVKNSLWKVRKKERIIIETYQQKVIAERNEQPKTNTKWNMLQKEEEEKTVCLPCASEGSHGLLWNFCSFS